ncbi:MAG: hypothetical protein QW478_00335 [Candidatus Micrarchaeaceae archaeon]
MKIYDYINIASFNKGRFLGFKIKSPYWQCYNGHIFTMSVNKLKKGKWCLSCGKSKGEREVSYALRDFNIPFVREYTFHILPSKSYDFYFMYNNKHYLLEFDGKQHFMQIKKFHRSKKQFLNYQESDIIKTIIPISYGINIIRIDYTQINHVKNHIINALTNNSILYLSNPFMYKHILMRIKS